MNAQVHPRLWAANARDVYQWWLNRSTVQITARRLERFGTREIHGLDNLE